MQTEIENNSARIIPEGDIDLTNAEKFKETFEELVEKEEVLHISLDFQHVDKIDSSGLGKILLFHKMIKEKGGSLQVENVSSEYVARVFEMVNLDEIIEIKNQD